MFLYYELCFDYALPGDLKNAESYFHATMGEPNYTTEVFNRYFKNQINFLEGNSRTKSNLNILWLKKKFS